MQISDFAPLIVVRDVATSVDFYRRLGFHPAIQWPTYAKLTAGAKVLHLASPGDPPPDRPDLALRAPEGTSPTVTAALVLQVEDCRRACADLVAAGIALLTTPAAPAWGGEVRAFVRDPDGHLIEINEVTSPT
ncbi:VOC family protein [Actinoplanes palleronii]|uniref:VOC family protein n=1 Tax=Actinoplanes palleronii TaxID=113570 RepID=UPI0031DB2181